MTGFLRLISAVAGVFLVSCAPPPAIDRDAAIESRAAEILSRMTLEEKVGQILQADIGSVTPDDVRNYNLGSVLNGGNSAPGGGKTAPPEQWIALADAFWEASTDVIDGGVGIPVIWGADAVHGHNNLQSATIFPHNSALGATRDPGLIREIGAVTAREARATGVDWTFAPTLAVARDDRWGRTYESYSENPQLVADYAAAMVEGLQGESGSADFLNGVHVIATAKHFVGDGGTQFGIDKGDTRGDFAEILEIHGAGYRPAFAAGVQTVMASFSSINGEKMHGSRRLLTEVLRGEMGFSGFVVGDWNGHAEVPGCTATDCVAALVAGVDMFMAPDSWKGLYESLLEHARSGELPLERLDEAVLRILKTKIRAGLFEAPKPSLRPGADPAALGAQAHREIARRAVRQSLVLLKNDRAILPIDPRQLVLVAGEGAHSIQQQTGGWTLSWQGDNNANAEFAHAETIYEGIRDAVEASGGRAILSVDGQYEEKPDVAIVVFGEHPYAEYRGDRSDLVFEFDDGENLALLRRLKSSGVPVVSVFLTGRPLWVNPHINASDAFVVAWLPGTEGGGIADVLIGDADGAARFDFTGKLAFSWPATGSGAPINSETDPGVLHPYGFGLAYGDRQSAAALPEDPGVKMAGDVFDGAIVSRGDPAPPFEVFLGDPSNANTPSPSLVGSSLSGAISSAGVDYKAQEDAREFAWTGAAAATVRFRAPRPIDLTGLGDVGSLALRLEWRVRREPGKPLMIAMSCGSDCLGELDVAAMDAASAAGQWHTTSIPLRCFIDAGLDPTKVESALQISGAGKARAALHEARIVQSELRRSCAE